MTDILTLQLRYSLSPAQAKLLAMLLDNRVVTAAMIEDGEKIASDAGVAIFRLRERMADESIEIQSRRALGFWLSPDTRKRLQIEIADYEKNLPRNHGGNEPEGSPASG